MPEAEHIKVKLRQLTPYPNSLVLPEDGVYVWEQATGILRQANVSQLPFGSGGGSGQPLVGSPFKVRNGDEGVTIDVTGTTVSDLRLLGKTDYPVNASQLGNNVFRDDEIEYNSTDGSVFIPDFFLSSGEVLVLYPDGVAGSGGSGGNLQPLIDRLDELERMTAPFKPGLLGANGGSVWWSGSVETIPAGWVVDTTMAGYLPMSMKSSDADFATVGGVGGAKTHTNTIGEMATHSHEQGSESLYSFNGGGSLNGNRNYQSGPYPSYSGQNTGDKGSGTPWNIMNPYKIGNWIKYVGI